MPVSFAFKARYLTTRLIPKSGGRFRKIIIPRGKLREAQDLALAYLQHNYSDCGRYGIALLDCHTAFKRGCNAYMNAERHLDFGMSVKFDIKDFFDSVPGFPRRARRISSYYERRRQSRRDRAKTRGQALPTSKYHATALSVFECLLREGIPEDIARWITDIATLRGYLYQGSPLSPLLSSLVTKHCLAKKMLKLATVYDLPIFTMFGKWHMVISFKGDKVWYHGADTDSLQFKMVQHILRRRICVRGLFPVCTKQAPVWEEMTRQENETHEQMLLRYGNMAWAPRKSGFISKARRSIIRKIFQPGGKGAEKHQLEYHDMKHHPLGKCVFTLYADDGVFSSNNRRLFMVRHVIRRVIEDSGFRVNTKKGIRVMRRSRFITGYQVAPGDTNTRDPGVRLDWKTTDREYRVALHHMKIGRRPMNEETIRHFEGKLAYLKLSNPNSWAVYAARFRDLILNMPATDPASPMAMLIAERYKDL